MTKTVAVALDMELKPHISIRTIYNYDSAPQIYAELCVEQNNAEVTKHVVKEDSVKWYGVTENGDRVELGSGLGIVLSNFWKCRRIECAYESKV